ncbi:MAG: hypothetical protein AB7P69_14865 [Candidatus Binatia bacterium]
MGKQLLAFFLTITACCLIQATLGTAETVSSDYFPLALGNRWVYESSEGTEEAPALESWEVIRQEGAAFVVRIQQPFVTLDGIEEQFVVEAEGVTRRVPDSDPPESQLILKLPVVAGARWQSGDGVYAVTALGEPVTTPAGSFANCVEITRWNKATKITIVSTYAPGVGLIHREETFPVIGGLGSDFETSARGRTVLRLKEYVSSTLREEEKGHSRNLKGPQE